MMEIYKNISSKEEIIKLYMEDRLPISKMAVKFKVSHKTMARAMKFHGIALLGRRSSNIFLADKVWLRKKYLEEKKSIRAIAKESGSTQGNVYSVLRHAKIPMRTVKEGVALVKRIGPATPNWKGGRYKVGARGRYFKVWAHGHPFANRDGYVMEHRLVMEKKLGRFLAKEEIVHHRDGDGHNNKISNLQLTTKKKHFKAHFNGVKSVKKYKKENARLKKLLDIHNIVY